MKSLTFLFLLSLCAPALAADAPATGKTIEPRELLQQGLFEEEANRDFEKAADAYARLLKEYDRQRALAATALFRLAEIRAKQGNKREAIALHQRLLAEFPNHDPLAKLSRERLAVLGGGAPTVAVSVNEPTDEEARELARIREMTTNSPDLLNAVTIDLPNERRTPLARAAANGWLRIATLLLENGVQINGTNDSERPLHAAAANGHKSIVELLLQRGADINALGTTGETALILACANRRAEVARLLLDRGADAKFATAGGLTALHAACVMENAELARILIEKGALPNVVASAAPLSGGGQIDGTPLYHAVSAQQPEVVQLLLDSGADPNIPHPSGAMTPLFAAVGLKDETLAALLLARGAKPDVVDDQGNSPLHYAAQHRAPQLVRLLLENGASPNLANEEGDTPCHVTLIRRGDFANIPSKRRSAFGSGEKNPDALLSAKDVATARAVLEALVGKGANLNLQNASGWSVLHYAMGLESVPAEIALWLIEQGADPEAKDRSVIPGRTPLEFATAARRLFFEKRLVFPKLVKERAVSARIRTASQPRGETVRTDSVAEFELPPTLLELLRENFVRSIATMVTESADLAVYRAGEGDAIKEIARARLNMDDGSKTVRFGAEGDPAKWPALRWGDVVAFEGGSGASFGKDPNTFAPDVLPHKVVPVSVALGERRGQLTIGDVRLVPDPPALPGSRSRRVPAVLPQVPAQVTPASPVIRSQNPPYSVRVWSPAKPLPLWRLSELIECIIAAEPRAQLDAVKLQRTVDGTVKEWIIDMREGVGVKELPARMSDGDTIVIPLLPVSPEALARRRAGIFQTAPGRLLGQQVLRRENHDDSPRTLSEFLMQSYLSGEMVVPLPDLSKITIYRLTGDTGAEEKLTVDLTTAIGAANPSKDSRTSDVPLEWGDIVEIQSTPGSVEQWEGFTPQTVLFLQGVLRRAVSVSVNGASKPVRAFYPDIPTFTQGGTFRTVTDGELPPFSLQKIARRAELRLDELVSARIRSGERVREFTRDQLRAIEPWVQDGDSVEFQRL